MRQISFWFLAGTLGFVVACGRAQDRKSNMESMSPAASTPGGAGATADAVDVSFKTQPDPLQVGENTFRGSSREARRWSPRPTAVGSLPLTIEAANV